MGIGIQNPPAPPAPGTAPATTVTLFTGKRMADPSTGVGVEATCTDARGTFQSMTVFGSVKIWSEKGCKGKSAVVSEDISDVAAELGFLNGIQSFIRP